LHGITGCGPSCSWGHCAAVGSQAAAACCHEKYSRNTFLENKHFSFADAYTQSDNKKRLLECQPRWVLLTSAMPIGSGMQRASAHTILSHRYDYMDLTAPLSVPQYWFTPQSQSVWHSTQYPLKLPAVGSLAPF
jgi:hypothetical protein